MESNYYQALARVLEHEGGWADHPRDPGGATMKGVTLATYRRHYGAGRTKDELRHIPDYQVSQIYRSGYWDTVRGADLPGGLDYAVFDFSVNSGPRRAAKFLQRALGVVADGVVGEQTLKAAKKQPESIIIRDLCRARLSWLGGLSTWGAFGRGWTRRVEGVQASALKMIDVIDAATTPDAASGGAVLSLGSRGPAVARLQRGLRIKDDGVFGPRTERRVRAFQTSTGLHVDGIAGKNTLRAMNLIA